MNADHIRLAVNTENGHDSQYCNDESVFVEWIERTIPAEKLCEHLAKTWTTDAMWKLERQPDGKDGKRAIALLEKLKSNKGL